MILENLNKYKIVLASNSPRRRELLAGLGIHFEVHTLEGVDESYPSDLPFVDIAEYIAQKKAHAYKVEPDELLITADTIVVAEGEVLGKPCDREDACRMLRLLSRRTHQVITGVCLCSATVERHFSVKTDVMFKQLTEAEIAYYVDTYQPYDKAGAYGIQEWIGYIGCTGLHGSYYNVMGLPVQRIYQELLVF